MPKVEEFFQGLFGGTKEAAKGPAENTPAS
jgi:hypothetical protein